MYPYFLVYFFVSLFSLFGYFSKKNFWFVLIFVMLTLFSGFRYNVGVDFMNYVNMYDLEQGSESHEYGFTLLIFLLHKIHATSQALFLIISIIMQLLVYKIIRRYNFNMWLSVSIYYCISTFYIATFNGMRQYVAIAILILSLKYIETRELKKYLGCLLTGAFFFHESILVFIPLYYCIHKILHSKLKYIP